MDEVELDVNVALDELAYPRNKDAPIQEVLQTEIAKKGKARKNEGEP